MSRIVLIVDSSHAEADHTRRQVGAALPGSECIVAHSGEAALGALAERRLVPSMILSEFALPDMNGIEFLGLIRQERWLAGVPVAMLSDAASDREIVSSYRLGLKAFLGKPARLMELRETLKDFAREAQVLSAAALVERSEEHPHSAAA